MPFPSATIRRPSLPLGLLAVAALAAACGAEKKGKSYLPAYVVNGDPNNLIRNTLPRTTSPFTKTNAGQFKNYFPARANEFVKRTRNAGGKSQREIEEDSRSVSGNGGSAFYRFVDKGAGVWSF